MSTVTLPTPTITSPRYHGEKSRTRVVTYDLAGTEVTTATGTEKVAVQISVGHSKERKQFYAVANQVVLRVEEYGTSTSFHPFEGVTLARLPVARYSDKALSEFLAGVLDMLPDWVAGSAKLAAMFVKVTARA